MISQAKQTHYCKFSFLNRHRKERKIKEQKEELNEEYHNIEDWKEESTAGITKLLLQEVIKKKKKKEKKEENEEERKECLAESCTTPPTCCVRGWENQVLSFSGNVQTLKQKT